MLCRQTVAARNLRALASGFRPMAMTQRMMSQSTANKATLKMEAARPQTATAKPAAVRAPASEAHLQTLSTKELISLGVIGFATINKPMLDLVLKMFPLVPVWLMKLLVSSLYCGGDNFQEVRETGKRLQERGINNMMLSLTIEDAEGTKNINIGSIVSETIASIHQILKPNLQEQLDTVEDVNSIPPGYIALKPSALVSNPYETLLHFNDPEWKAQREALVNNCVAITEEIFKLNQEFAKKYPERKIPFFVSVIDAEKYSLQKAGVYELQRILFQKFNPRDSSQVSCVGTWQLYLTDSASDLAKEYERAEREGYKLGLKIVRGAYIHSEPNRSTVIHPDQASTDANFNTVMKNVITDLLEKGDQSTYGHLVVASHNYESNALATKLLEGHDGNIGKANVVLGQLLGMADNVTHDLINNQKAKNVIKYVPWGPPVETKDYLFRRMQENGDAVRADNGFPLVKSVTKVLLRSLFGKPQTT
ncbi:proline dehydrogenase [Lachancea thermotolerans CBS 6340]|uniref:Proline dehydrogenase n=1 Tax=Lachancea thermotolerans (strain ATCC 56472 / CBS 6340 / NRRL Y-8284) TaxID=559295 RepID=C5DMU1_LACTC|nr:KLTH0G11616p [Lachancea thermotolerans CBS 6340]CAR25102.1 KLTH0G11616p [Lachancea thermotolerans CBS 6340]